MDDTSLKVLFLDKLVMVTLSDEIVNTALPLSMEFGPHLGQPIAPRLKNQFPQLTAEELEYCEGLCKKIKKDAFDFLDQRYMDLSDHNKYKQMQVDMKTYLHQLYPWIDEKNMSYLFSQNVYLVSK